METYLTTIFVVADEVLRMLNIRDDPQAQMSNAEIISFAIFSSKFFSSNFKLARYFGRKLKLFPNILSNSRLNRRLHQIPKNFWDTFIKVLGIIFQQTNDKNAYAVDSFPVLCCQKNRIDKRHLFISKEYLGFAASKKRYFCGIKIHMIVTGDGKPVEVFITPGSMSDVKALWHMKLEIPIGSKLYADGAYNSFELEDVLKEEGIQLLAKRGIKAKTRVRTEEEERGISSRRQIVETAFSSITNLFPRNLRAVTEMGLFIKVYASILAYSFTFLCQVMLA